MEDKTLDEILEDVRHAHYYAEYHSCKTQEEINLQIKEHVEKCKQQILAWHSAELDKAVIKELQNMESTYRELWRDDFADQVMFYREKRIKELSSTNQVSDGNK